MHKGFGAFLIFGIVFIGLALVLLGEHGVLPYRANGEPNHRIFFEGTPIRVEIADTQEERARGLSGRDPLPPNTGMLFVFDRLGKPGFWMKDMNFSIDIFWLADDGTVVDIKNDARPESYPTTFRPAEYSRYVLEMNAGFAEVYQIERGDQFDLSRLTNSAD